MNAEFVAFHGFMKARRGALVDAIRAQVKAEVRFLREMQDRDRDMMVELVVDVVLHALEDYRPEALIEWAGSPDPVPIARGMGLRDAMKGLSIARGHLLLGARAAVEAGVAGAWTGLARVSAVIDDLTAAFANRFHGELAAAHRRLQESEARFRGLYERTPAMLHTVDREGSIMAVSDRWLDTLGYRREEVLGKKTLDFMTDASRRRAAEELLPELFRTGHCADHALQLVRKDGEILDVRVSSIVETNEAGERLQNLTVIVDVTEQLRAQHALRETAEALRRSAAQEAELRAQAETLRALSTPLIPVSERVVVLPLVGKIDAVRAEHIIDALLRGVVQHGAAVAILDVTGVPDADHEVADALVRAAQAVRLLGATVVLTGVQPAMAQTMVALGTDLEGVVTRGTLMSGIAYAMGR